MAISFDIGTACKLIKKAKDFIYLWCKMPSIKIKPLVSNNTATLEVYNNGGCATFKAVARIIKGHPSRLGQLYALYWEGDGTKATIGKYGIAKIVIASQEIIMPNRSIIGLAMFVMKDGGKSRFNGGVWPLGEHGEILRNTPPENIYLEVSIFAEDQPLKRRFNDIKFILSQASITKLNFAYIGCKTRKLKLDKEGYLK